MLIFQLNLINGSVEINAVNFDKRIAYMIEILTIPNYTSTYFIEILTIPDTQTHTDHHHQDLSWTKFRKVFRVCCSFMK